MIQSRPHLSGIYRVVLRKKKRFVLRSFILLNVRFDLNTSVVFERNNADEKEETVSRSRKGSKGPGHEFWGKRSALSGLRDPGKYTKRQTHRAERRQDKKIIKEQKEE